MILTVVILYFVVLFIISWWTGRNADEQTFFAANKSSPWYLVAFGMIGATLSGVTFISVPGAVGTGSWAYLQLVLGNLLGFIVIAFVLLPLYYRLNLTSIYGYLEKRFGTNAYKTGAVYFLVSRVIGASFRLYLVALVLQIAIFDDLGIPFWLTVFISIALIYIYTYRGGIKTVVWTDTLQTFFLLFAAGLTVYLIANELNLGPSELVQKIQESSYSQTFFWDWGPSNQFFKMFFSGMFITIVMVGLDQDMMQKNLTCKTLKDAQTNMLSFSGVFVLANILFLSLGALLYIYGQETGLVEAGMVDGKFQLLIKDAVSGEMLPQATDKLFPILTLDYLGPLAAVVFVLGVIAAAYSSADSALTALTTSFCVDILGFEKRSDEEKKRRIRYQVHLAFAAVLLVVILLFKLINDDAVINALFRMAGYTYGPLLGMFAFGMITNMQVKDFAIPFVCILSPILTWVIQYFSPQFGYEFGFEILILNGLLTMGGLLIFRDAGSEKREAR